MSCQLAPISCSCCQCDASVVVNLAGGGGGEIGGDDDPNVAGVIPANPAVWSTYNQTIPGTPAVVTIWKWNPAYQTWV